MATVLPLHPLGTRRRSALQAFTECQFRWNQVYRQGVVDESAEARRGTTFHACAKHYVQALFARRLPADLDLAREAFIAGVAEAPCPADLLDDVDQLFWRWAETFELDVNAYLLSEEQPADPDGYELRLDLAYAKGDVIEIPDWKTHWAIWSKARVAESFQGKFYASRARRIWPGFTLYRFIMVFVRFNAAVAVEYSQADLDRFDAQVAAIEAAQAEAIARGTFAPTPGDHCGYCSLACPAADDVRIDPVRATSPEVAASIGEEYLALLQAVSARRQVLHAYTAIHGPLDVRGVTFAHEAKERKRFPAAQVVDVLREAEITPVFTIGTTPIRSFLTARKWAHVTPELEALARIETKTQFVTTRTAVGAPVEEEDADA